MITSLRSMLTCRWAAGRIQRYLDADPDAPLDPAEVDRLEAHMSQCARCGSRAEEYRALGVALRAWSSVRAPAPLLVARMHEVAQRLVAPESA